MADQLREEWIPGAVSLVLVIVAIVVGAWLIWRRRRQRQALKWATGLIERAADRKDFVVVLPEVDREFQDVKRRADGRFARFSKTEYRRPIAVAWGEYYETMVLPEPGSDQVVRNSIRPSSFFDPEDLGFGAGVWRIAPGMFVSVGLLLTFLGLIAALTAIGGGEINDDSLRELLNAASAKFIMSLTGLFCSIILTMVLRFGLERIEDDTRKLCHAIEKRLRFQSLEEIAADQLEATREQATAMRQVATEMVAELSRPLKEDLPNAIGASIKAEVGPLLDQLGRSGEQGVGQLVGDLSEQLSGDIGTALGQASSRLAEAGDRLAELAEKLEGGSGRMGQEYEAMAGRMAEQLGAMQTAMQTESARSSDAMSKGVERLLEVMTESLDAIRENTGAGAQAIAEAAAGMEAAAESFRKEIETATTSGSALAGAEMERAAQAAGGAIAEATGDLTAPLARMAEQLETAATATRDSAAGLERAGGAARAGGDAMERGAERFDAASATMAEAAEPIRGGLSEMNASVRALSDGMRASLDTVSQNSAENARRTRDSLEAAQEILGQERKGVADAMDGLAVALRELRGQGDRIDTIDAKLGAAFETYRDQVEATMSGTSDQVRRIVETLDPALDTMRSVVEQAETFAPQSAARSNGEARDGSA